MPAYIETNLTNTLGDAATEAMTDSIPLGRTGTPENAGAVLFLASSAASCITDHVLHVDGGLAM